MGDITNRIAGTAYLTVDGISYALRGEFSYNPSSVTRETAIGMDGVHGYIEKPFAPGIKGKLSDAGGLTVAGFNAMTNNTVMAELANGKVVVGRNMWTVETQEVDATEGTFEVHWEGPSVVEI